LDLPFGEIDDNTGYGVGEDGGGEVEEVAILEQDSILC
jgi:hypothetical protein